jgi:hypothetical protein
MMILSSGSRRLRRLGRNDGLHFLDPTVRQPTAFSRADFAPRGVKRSRPRRSGARGTPGSRTRREAPLGPADLSASRHRGLPKSYEPQVRRSPGVPRAVFEVCSARPPVGLPFRRNRRLPTAAGPDSAAGGQCRQSKRLCHRGPSGARLARRDRAAWTSGKRCALGTAGRPPHPVPHHEALSRRPPSGQGDRNIVLRRRYVKPLCFG